MGHAYSPKDTPGRSSAPAAARLQVAAADPFKAKAERDAARRTGRMQDGFGLKPKAPKAKAADTSRMLGGGPALRVIASSDPPPVARPAARKVKAPPLMVVASSAAASSSDAPVVTDATFTELPKERISEKAFRPSDKRGGRGGGGNGAGGPPVDRIFNQDDLAGVLIVLALLLLIALYLVRGGGAPAPAPQRLVSTASVEPAPVPAPLVDPFGDKPVDLTPKSPPPPPAVAAAPAPAPVCPSGRVMRAWFCTAESELTQASRAALEKGLKDWGSCLTGKQLVVTGYADTRGGPDYNAVLSRARASAVADALRAKGVKVAEAAGAGELPGLADNENCANQRRVDVRLSDDPSAPPPSKSCAPPDEFAALSCG
jgi:outer membrane protein OmpA-like peptidoglycan-associated protein